MDSTGTLKRKAIISMLLIPLGILVCTGKAGAHTITIPSNVYFHLWKQNTYINFASTTSLDNIIQTSDKLYLNQHWFSVENANLTISKFFLGYQLIFFVKASSETLSITQIYVDDWGEPTSIYSPNGTLTWNYDSPTEALSFRIVRFGQVEIIVDWRIIGDVNGDGVVNASDLSGLNGAYGSDQTKPSWNSNCDFNRDGVVNASDLYGLGKNYGNRK